MRSLLLAFGCASLVACTYGGSEQDPRDRYTADPAVEESSLDASSSNDNGSATPPPSGLRDSSPGGASGLDGSSSVRSDAANGCTPARPPSVCDPVRNSGCPPIPLMQCDVDPTAAEPTGRCAIFTPTPIVPCSATTTASSTACLPTSTCVEGVCRQLCYCDSDCLQGQRCTGSVGGGFLSCS